jgi:hypothetical protein
MRGTDNFTGNLFKLEDSVPLLTLCAQFARRANVALAKMTSLFARMDAVSRCPLRVNDSGRIGFVSGSPCTPNADAHHPVPRHDAERPQWLSGHPLADRSQGSKAEHRKSNALIKNNHASPTFTPAKH